MWFAVCQKVPCSRADGGAERQAAENLGGHQSLVSGTDLIVWFNWEVIHLLLLQAVLLSPTNGSFRQAYFSLKVSLRDKNSYLSCHRIC